MDLSGFVFQERNIGGKIEVVLWVGIKESFRDIGRAQMRDVAKGEGARGEGEEGGGYE